MNKETYKKILTEAIEELKENEFKTLFNSKKSESSFVKDCSIETDFELVIPDDYVNQITERFNLYKELDEIKDETELINFEASIIDRFGPIPIETAELIKTIRLRWLAKEIGFERLILKSNVLIGTFVTNQQSAYYQSEQFSKVLNYVQQEKVSSKMTEKNNKLRLRFDDVNNIQQAIEKLRLLNK